MFAEVRGKTQAQLRALVDNCTVQDDALILAHALHALQFFGARTNEHRGVCDMGLSVPALWSVWRVLSRVPYVPRQSCEVSRTFERVSAYLEGL